MQEFVGKHGVPVGTYTGRCKDIEIVEHPEYGKRALFMFEITEGSESGKDVVRYVSTTPSNRNSCGRLISGMIGHPILDDEHVRFSALTEPDYELEVVETESGAVRVEAAMLISSDSNDNVEA